MLEDLYPPTPEGLLGEWVIAPPRPGRGRPGDHTGHPKDDPTPRRAVMVADFGMGHLLSFSVPQFRLAGAHSWTVQILFAKGQGFFGEVLHGMPLNGPH